jgi:hypothetical protein
MARPDVTRQEKIEKLSRFSDIPRDEIYAASLSREKLAGLFNKATEYTKWAKTGKISALVALVGFICAVSSSGTGNPPYISAAATAVGTGLAIRSIFKLDDNEFRGELNDAVTPPPVVNDRKEPGRQMPAP